ncbi:MAG: hypothetical protein N2487_01810 [Verrucomicrobiae bacterium]|nr:hypothetical protein [Verrucomicrobiae bacterium]
MNAYFSYPAVAISLAFWALFSAFVGFAQEIKEDSLTILAIKKDALYTGFDVVDGKRTVAVVRFSSGMAGLVAENCEIDKDGRAIKFSRFKYSKDTGAIPGDNDYIRIGFIKNEPYPVISFDLSVVGFDQKKWIDTVGKEPFHFLTLHLPRAEVWHTRGWLNATPYADRFPLLIDPHAGTPEISAYHYNRNWSYTVPLGAHPLPVIGLWAIQEKHYVGYEFQTTRVKENSEHEIATGYRWIENSGSLKAEEAQFVALVYPFGGQGYQQLVLPKAGARLKSQCRLIWNLNLSSEDDPNRFLWGFWWQRIRDTLPKVPPVADVSWIPGGLKLRDFQGPPRGGLIGGPEAPFSREARVIGGWTWHNESPTAQAAKANDTRRLQSFQDQAATLLKYVKRFKVNGEECVFWEKPIEGQWTEEWGGKAVITLHNANGFAAGRLFLGLYRDAGKSEYLEIVDGVLNWAKYIVWTRNEFADVPSSPFAIGGTLSASFCLEYYMTFKNSTDSERKKKAQTALELARSFTYRYMTLWPSDNNRFDNLDSSFLWEPNSGRDWTGAACANEVFWNLDTLAQTAVHTGDPILMWAIQGSLSRWHLMYQDVIKNNLSEYQARDMTEGYGLYPGNVYGFGKRAAFGFAAPLVMTEPVGNSSARILIGEKSALVFRKCKEYIRIIDYQYTPDGNFAFTVISTKPQFDISLTAPYCDISEKQVTIVRSNNNKVALKAGEDFIRPQQALWSLYIKNVNPGDRIIVGEPDSNANFLPTVPPLAYEEENSNKSASAEALPEGFSIVKIPHDSAPDLNRESPEGWLDLPRGNLWFYGIPFYLSESSERCTLKTPKKFPQTIKDVEYVYILFSAGKGEEPKLIFNSNEDYEQARQTALAWKAWPPIYSGRLLVSQVKLKKGAEISGIDPSGGMVWAITIVDAENASSEYLNITFNAMARGSEEWNFIRQQEGAIQILRGAVSNMPQNKIAILPPSPSGAMNGFLQRIGLTDKAMRLSNNQLVDSSIFNPKNTPVALYLDGEDYVHTVNAAGDGAAAVERFLKEGGTLIIAGSLPWPMFYATGGMPRRSDALTGRLGLPLNMAIEGAPTEKVVIKINQNQDIIKTSVQEFNYPEGDTRLRAIVQNRISKDVKYTPIATVVSASGKVYGDAAGLLEFPNGGKILYIAHILQNDPIYGFEIRDAVAKYLINSLKK